MLTLPSLPTLLVAGLAALASLAGTAAAGDWRHTEIGGRKIMVYTPERLEGRAAPMLLALHSDFGTPEGFAETFPIYMHADRLGFRVAYAEGARIARVAEHRDWNAGDCCGAAAQQGVDDVAFLRAVADGAVAEGLTHPESFFLFGHSNGAMMAYRFACAHPERLAGVVAVSGTLTTQGCGSAEGVTLLTIHGLLDIRVPYEGGQGETVENFGFLPVRDAVNALHHAGASVTLERVHHGAHAWGAMKRAYETQEGFPLIERIADFVDDHAFR